MRREDPVWSYSLKEIHRIVSSVISELAFSNEALVFGVWRATNMDGKLKFLVYLEVNTSLAGDEVFSIVDNCAASLSDAGFNHHVFSFFVNDMEIYV